jgi:small subunit ribosomal protein S16
MAVTIRLSRQGAKKDPKYLIVAVNTSSKRDGGFIAKLGQYFPKAAKDADKVRIDAEALKHWKSVGAQFSKTAGEVLKPFLKQA